MVCDADTADGVRGVVDGGEHDGDAVAGGGQVCGGADGAGAGGCPVRAGVGQPPGPQNQVPEVGGGRGAA